MAIRTIMLAALGTAVTVVVAVALYARPASAADLGGNCCADLEERIAELEATAARKGNRKVSLTVSGQISKALVWTDAGDYSDWAIGDNSNVPSYVSISGRAKINSEWSAAYVLEIGIGGYEAGFNGYGFIEGDTNGLYVRKSYVQLKSKSVGGITIGKASQASDGITLANTSNSGVASTPLSLRPITGPGAGEALDLFDGTRANVVRYDTPIWQGWQASASIAAANFDSSGDTDGNVWDVALRYAGEFGGFKVAAGVAYRDGVVIDDDTLFGVPINVALGDVQVISGSASVMHVASGIFVSGAAGQLDFSDWLPGAPKITGYAGQVGIEHKMFGTLGKTTIYGEYGMWELSDYGFSNPTYWGGGVVQKIDAAAMDLYLSGRSYQEFGDLIGFDGNATVVMGGARIQF